jgi:hypothetical protein
MPSHYHLDRLGRVFDGLHLATIVPQHAVKAFCQNRIGGTENDVLHNGGYSAYAMPAGSGTFLSGPRARVNLGAEYMRRCVEVAKMIIKTVISSVFDAAMQHE